MLTILTNVTLVILLIIWLVQKHHLLHEVNGLKCDGHVLQ